MGSSVGEPKPQPLQSAALDLSNPLAGHAEPASNLRQGVRSPGSVDPEPQLHDLRVSRSQSSQRISNTLTQQRPFSTVHRRLGVTVNKEAAQGRVTDNSAERHRAWAIPNRSVRGDSDRGDTGGVVPRAKRLTGGPDGRRVQHRERILRAPTAPRRPGWLRRPGGRRTQQSGAGGAQALRQKRKRPRPSAKQSRGRRM